MARAAFSGKRYGALFFSGNLFYGPHVQNGPDHFMGRALWAAVWAASFLFGRSPLFPLQLFVKFVFSPLIMKPGI